MTHNVPNLRKMFVQFKVHIVFHDILTKRAQRSSNSQNLFPNHVISWLSAKVTVIFVGPTRDTKSFEIVEFKWKGTISQRVSIPPNSSRFLDAFHVYTDFPNNVFLGINPTITDFSKYTDDYLLKIPGDYKLNFVVFSENFSPLRETFYLRLGSKITDIKFALKREELAVNENAVPEAQAMEATTINADAQPAHTSGLDDFFISGQ